MKSESGIKIDRMIKLSDVLSTEVHKATQVVFLLSLHFINAFVKILLLKGVFLLLFHFPLHSAALCPCVSAFTDT